MPPIIYDASPSIINEGTTQFERFVVKITRIAGQQGNEFIKTFPFLHDRRNYHASTVIKNEMPPYRKNAYLGIGLKAYRYDNYIEFYSTFKAFPLNKNDSITCYFEDSIEMEFRFLYNTRKSGFLNCNIYPITDTELDFLSKNKLCYWVLENTTQNIRIVGGFTAQEGNKQYHSEKIGQGLFKKMAKQVLDAKPQLLLY